MSNRSFSETTFEVNYTNRSESKRTREVISNTDWNENWNLNSEQGDHSEWWLNKLYTYFFGSGATFDTTTSNKMADVTANTSNRHSHTNKALLDTYTQTEANLASAVSHLSNTSNPHSVTKAQVGLGNVDNTSDANKPISTATQAALDTKAAASALTSHTGNTSNPHSVTKAQLGLGNVDNTSDANKPISTATQTALNSKENTSNKVTAMTASSTDTEYPSAKAVYDAIASAGTSTVRSVNGRVGAVTLSSSDVGLGNCNNTSDADKPISTATQTALNAKADATATTTALATKAARDTDAVSGNLAKFDSSGNPIDTGYATNNILGLSYTVVSTWS